MAITDKTRTRARIRGSLLDTAQVVAVTAAVAAEIWRIYDVTQHAGWPMFDRLRTTGLLAVLVGLLVNAIANVALAGTRMRLNHLAYGIVDRLPDESAAADGPPLHATAEQALKQVEAATSIDAASRAANQAYSLDLGRDFLRSATRWRGYPNGEATFYLADGLILHFAMVATDYGNDAGYTLWAADNKEPVTLTSLAQLRQLLLDAGDAGSAWTAVGGR